MCFPVINHRVLYHQHFGYRLHDWDGHLDVASASPDLHLHTWSIPPPRLGVAPAPPPAGRQLNQLLIDR